MRRSQDLVDSRRSGLSLTGCRRRRSSPIERLHRCGKMFCWYKDLRMLLGGGNDESGLVPDRPAKASARKVEVYMAGVLRTDRLGETTRIVRFEGPPSGSCTVKVYSPAGRW